MRDKDVLSSNQNIYSAMHKKGLPPEGGSRIIRLSRIANAGAAAAADPNGVSSTLLLWCGFNAAPGAAFFLVRPAWAHSCGCKSRRKLITANEAKRNCVRVTGRGKEAWNISCERMDKNRIEGAAEQGEWANNREALVIEAKRRRSGGCAAKECVLTWGDLALCLKGRRCSSRSEKSAEAVVAARTGRRAEGRRPCRSDVQCIRSPQRRGATREGEVKPSLKRGAW
jgi:hypothetical protein